MKAEQETDAMISELVDRGGKLMQIVSAGERASVELNAIKARLREFANGKDRHYSGKLFSVSVEQKPETVCRVVEEIHVPRVLKLAGDALLKLFTLHPSKGGEKNFALNAFKALPKKSAQTLVQLLSVEASAWVRFSRTV